MKKIEANHGSRRRRGAGKGIIAVHERPAGASPTRRGGLAICARRRFLRARAAPLRKPPRLIRSPPPCVGGGFYKSRYIGGHILTILYFYILSISHPFFICKKTFSVVLIVFDKFRNNTIADVQLLRNLVDVASCITHFADSRLFLVGQYLAFPAAVMYKVD